MAHTIHIGLLEDDPVVGEMLVLAFTRAGWRCSHHTTVSAMTTALATVSFDLLVLDWVLPDGTAETIIRQVRNRPGEDVPILIESLKDDEARMVRALQLGADDYVVKPLRLAEVKARIEALLRRRRGVAVEWPSSGPFEVDMGRGLLLLDGVPVNMTRTEFGLICYLFQHAGELLTRDRLLREVWGTVPDLDTRTVDNHVSRLRKKLGLGPQRGVEIVTVHGYGYRLEVAPERVQ
ncbi:MAG: response regulator transcription factor [Rhodocyclaceae bacterium]|nr:response regulator transcription factor [Rhodocyclaceae bacterium]